MDKESRWYLLGVEARRAGRAHGDNPLPLPAAAFFVASEPRSGECRWMHGGGGWEAEDQRCKRSSWTQDGGSEGLGELVPSRWFRDGCGELGAGFCWVTASRD
jgi:hypothetical protein